LALYQLVDSAPSRS